MPEHRTACVGSQVSVTVRRSRLVPVGLAVAVALLACSALLGYRSTMAFADRARWLQHTHQVIEGVEHVRALAAKAGNEAYGYVLGGDESLVAARPALVAQAETALGHVGNLIQDNPTQRDRFETLASLFAERWALLDAAIAARREASDVSRALSLVARAQPVTARIHAIADQMRAEEEQRLAQRSQDADRSEASALLLIVGGSALSLLLFVTAFGLLIREMKTREIAQRALESSAREIEDLYQRAPCGYHSIDAEGRMVRINDTELSWLGYTRDEVVGKLQFLDLCTPASAEVFRRLFPSFQESGEVRNLELDLLRKDGSVMPVSVSASAIRDADGRFLMSRSIVLDIGERRRLAQDLDRIFTLSQDLLCVAGDDGLFKRINPAWGRLLGYDDDELTRRPFLEFVHPDDHAATVDAFERQIRAGQTIVSFENRYRCKDGSYRTLLWNSTPVVSEGLVYGAAHDITERNKSDERLRSLMESAPDAMIVVAEDGRIVLANAQTETLFGHARTELLQQPVETLIPERFRARHPEDVARYLSAPSVRAMGTGQEFFGLRRDGSEFPAEIGLSPMRSDGGLHVVAAIRDVTERRRNEDALRTAKETAEAANKELESFSYSVSHDLRAPLRAIDGFSRILLEEYGEKLDDEGQRLLGVLLTNTAKMGHLIDDLLAFSRLGRKPLRASRVDMNALVGGVLREALAASGSPPNCTVHPLPDAVGDPALLQQVWVNLISNAIKFTSRAERPEIEVGARDEENAVVYWVRDNGAGFDMRYAGKLFGVFQRLHRDAEFPGTGVGLAIVQRIVARHGGSVRAEGAVGAGASFEFSLPKRRMQP